MKTVYNISYRADSLNSIQSNRRGSFSEKSKQLTEREVEVLQLVAEGNANKEMALRLGISVKTVEKHRGHLMEKLGVHETAGLTRCAIGAGLVTVPRLTLGGCSVRTISVGDRGCRDRNITKVLGNFSG